MEPGAIRWNPRSWMPDEQGLPKMGGRQPIDAPEDLAEIVGIRKPAAGGDLLDGQADIAEEFAGFLNAAPQNVLAGREAGPAPKDPGEMAGAESGGAGEIGRSEATNEIRFEKIERLGDADMKGGIDGIGRACGLALEQAGENVEQECVGLEAGERLAAGEERDDVVEPGTDRIAGTQNGMPR